MKNLNENKKGWLRSLALVIALVTTSQIFIACGGGGGSSAPTPVPLPLGVGIGTFNYANCGGAVGTNLIACAIGKYPGFEVLVQISSATGNIAFGGAPTSYNGPVVVNGVINVLPGYGCAAATSYSFTTTAGQMNYYSDYGNLLTGTVNATGTSNLSVTFGNTFLMETGVAAISSTGQSFPYHLMNQIQIISAGGIGVGVGVGACVIPSGVYFLN